MPQVEKLEQRVLESQTYKDRNAAEELHERVSHIYEIISPPFPGPPLGKVQAEIEGNLTRILKDMRDELDNPTSEAIKVADVIHSYIEKLKSVEDDAKKKIFPDVSASPS